MKMVESPDVRTRHHIVVGIDMRHPSARPQIAGILRSAAGRPDWDVQLLGCHPSDEGWNDDPNWIPDGAILDEFSLTHHGGILRQKSIRAAVFTNVIPPKGLRIPHAEILTDERTIAVSAAELFVKRGLRNFAFVGSRRNDPWSIARMRFFKAALKDRGFSVNVYKAPRTRARDRKTLSEWLKTLPRPCGIFVAFDQRAKYVIDLCRSIGILIPEHLQILGVDNEDTVCENTRPTLSSIAPDFEGCGYSAAETLQALLSRKPQEKPKTRIRIREIVERMSTTDLTNSASRIERARDYIRTHAFTGISTGAVAKSIGGSQRLLEMNFKKVIGHSIHEEINLVRLAKVKDMLAKTSHSFDSIAAFCGFHNTNHLRNLFKARTGMTLSEWRERNQA